jgi:hypothetical protein
LRSLVILSLLMLTVANRPSRIAASDIPNLEHRLIGHPRNRFPLTIYAEPAASQSFDAAIREAVAQWNKVFERQFHVAAFTSNNNEARADILVQFTKSTRGHHEMGATDIDADRYGVIRLPVIIELNPPRPRGGTDVQQMLFDVTAHELGHALGLPHINKANSIMCCDPGAINFSDPATRAAYTAARRHPDFRSVEADLAAHYQQFWSANSPVRSPN